MRVNFHAQTLHVLILFEKSFKTRIFQNVLNEHFSKSFKTSIFSKSFKTSIFSKHSFVVKKIAGRKTKEGFKRCHGNDIGSRTIQQAIHVREEGREPIFRPLKALLATTQITFALMQSKDYLAAGTTTMPCDALILNHAEEERILIQGFPNFLVRGAT